MIGTFVLLILYVTSNRKESSTRNDTNEHDISLKRLLHVAIEAAERGGREIRNLKEPLIIQNKGKTKEGVNDSVTNADLKSHCVMYNTLMQTFPEMHVVSEEDHKCDFVDLKINLEKNGNEGETDATVPVDKITVWIDPLDATKEYTGRQIELLHILKSKAVVVTFQKINYNT